jgi:hypothetical protein
VRYRIQLDGDGLMVFLRAQFHALKDRIMHHGDRSIRRSWGRTFVQERQAQTEILREGVMLRPVQESRTSRVDKVEAQARR